MKMPRQEKPSLREARERLGLSQEEMAARLGLSQATVSRLENGQTLLRRRLWRYVADEYKVDVATVIGEAA